MGHSTQAISSECDRNSEPASNILSDSEENDRLQAALAITQLYNSVQRKVGVDDIHTSSAPDNTVNVNKRPRALSLNVDHTTTIVKAPSRPTTDEKSTRPTHDLGVTDNDMTDDSGANYPVSAHQANTTPVGVSQITTDDTTSHTLFQESNPVETSCLNPGRRPNDKIVLTGAHLRVPVTPSQVCLHVSKVQPKRRQVNKDHVVNQHSNKNHNVRMSLPVSKSSIQGNEEVGLTLDPALPGNDGNPRTRAKRATKKTYNKPTTVSRNLNKQAVNNMLDNKVSISNRPNIRPLSPSRNIHDTDKETERINAMGRSVVKDDAPSRPRPNYYDSRPNSSKRLIEIDTGTQYRTGQKRSVGDHETMTTVPAVAVGLIQPSQTSVASATHSQITTVIPETHLNKVNVLYSQTKQGDAVSGGTLNVLMDQTSPTSPHFDLDLPKMTQASPHLDHYRLGARHAVWLAQQNQIHASRQAEKTITPIATSKETSYPPPPPLLSFNKVAAELYQKNPSLSQSCFQIQHGNGDNNFKDVKSTSACALPIPVIQAGASPTFQQTMSPGHTMDKQSTKNENQPHANPKSFKESPESRDNVGHTKSSPSVRTSAFHMDAKSLPPKKRRLYLTTSEECDLNSPEVNTDMEPLDFSQVGRPEIIKNPLSKVKSEKEEDRPNCVYLTNGTWGTQHVQDTDSTSLMYQSTQKVIRTGPTPVVEATGTPCSPNPIVIQPVPMIISEISQPSAATISHQKLTVNQGHSTRKSATNTMQGAAAKSGKPGRVSVPNSRKRQKSRLIPLESAASSPAFTPDRGKFTVAPQ